MERKISLTINRGQNMVISFGEGPEHALTINLNDGHYVLSAKSLYEKIDYSMGDVFTGLDEDFFQGENGIDDAKEIWTMVKNILEEVNSIKPSNEEFVTKDIKLPDEKLTEA